MNSVGLGEIIKGVEVVQVVWKAIRDSRSFGHDMVALDAKLSMEYYRFISWAKVTHSVHREADSKGSLNLFLLPRDNALSLDLCTQVQAPISAAVAQVLRIFEAIANITQKYGGCLEKEQAKTQLRDSEARTVADGVHFTLPIVGVAPSPCATAVSNQRKAAAQLQTRVPFSGRVKFSTSVWGESDKEKFERELQDLMYWNNRLEALLHPRLQMSLATQAVPGLALHDGSKHQLDDFIEASEGRTIAVGLHAKLWQQHAAVSESNRGGPDGWGEFMRDVSDVQDSEPKQIGACQLSIAHLNGQAGEFRGMVTIEKYPYSAYGWRPDEQSIAKQRLAELVYLSSSETRPCSLRILRARFFVDDGSCFKYVCDPPSHTTEDSKPVSLWGLLGKTGVMKHFRHPPLEYRLSLARNIAASVYSLNVARWLHKDLNSRNIVFFWSPSSNMTMLESPYLTGFSIARPDSDREVSLNMEEERRAIFLHPDLRIDNESRPRYHRKHDLYGLGLLLLEIGLWQTLDELTQRYPKDPVNFTISVIEASKKYLPFWTGYRYMDVVLACLTASDDLANSLEAVYTEIILELEKCQMPSP